MWPRSMHLYWNPFVHTGHMGTGRMVGGDLTELTYALFDILFDFQMILWRRRGSWYPARDALLSDGQGYIRDL